MALWQGLTESNDCGEKMRTCVYPPMGSKSVKMFHGCINCDNLTLIGSSSLLNYMMADSSTKVANESR